MQLTHNQVILARILAEAALSKARQKAVLSPQQRMLQALDEAIEDRRGALNELPAGGVLYLVTLDQIKRWEEVRRANR